MDSHQPFLQVFLQTGAAVISSDVPVLNVDDLADQVAEVLDYFGYITPLFILFI